MKLNNGLEIPQIGVGTWTLRGEVARQNVQNVQNLRCQNFILNMEVVDKQCSLAAAQAAVEE